MIGKIINLSGALRGNRPTETATEEEMERAIKAVLKHAKWRDPKVARSVILYVIQLYYKSNQIEHWFSTRISFPMDQTRIQIRDI